MAHYDCTNCGHRMGIAFGYCERCTPEEYLEIKGKIQTIQRKIDDEWEIASKHMKEVFSSNRKHQYGVVDLENKLKELEKEHKR